MLILAVKTDQPIAEIALYQDLRLVERYEWQAHRLLAVSLHQQIHDLLKRHGHSLDQLEALVAYSGPGSFTGLRIGLSVVNALADSYDIPATGVFGDSETGDNHWAEQGVERLRAGESDTIVMPEYGAEVRITPQRK